MAGIAIAREQRGTGIGVLIVESGARKPGAADAAGRTDWLDGWMLSRTEGRLAALLALAVRRGTQAGAGIPR